MAMMPKSPCLSKSLFLQKLPQRPKTVSRLGTRPLAGMQMVKELKQPEVFADHQVEVVTILKSPCFSKVCSYVVCRP